MSENIALVEKGKKPTLLEAEKANELIRAINAFRNMEIVIGGVGSGNRVEVNEDKVIISLDVQMSGYYEKEIQVCEGDAVVFYVMLVKDR